MHLLELFAQDTIDTVHINSWDGWMTLRLAPRQPSKYYDDCFDGNLQNGGEGRELYRYCSRVRDTPRLLEQLLELTDAIAVARGNERGGGETVGVWEVGLEDWFGHST